MDDKATPAVLRLNGQLGFLPEPPAFYRYQFQSHYGPVWRSSAENWNGCPPLASEGLYSADQMRAYAAQEVAAERERQRQVIAYMAVNRSGTVRFTDNPDAARELEGYGWAITPLADAGPN